MLIFCWYDCDIQMRMITNENYELLGNHANQSRS